MHETFFDYALELVFNAFEAHASEISIRFTQSPETFLIEVCDNADGISSEASANVKNPFFTDPQKHPRRKTGLGLPLLDSLAVNTGGLLSLRPAPRAPGTIATLRLNANHPDTPPRGNFIEFALLVYDRLLPRDTLRFRRTLLRDRLPPVEYELTISPHPESLFQPPSNVSPNLRERAALRQWLLEKEIIFLTPDSACSAPDARTTKGITYV